ncbi:MAG: CAP domain-containing protein [Gaiellales bacterium]|nr:MAG: CAP domain-containing protein [Gaiellales bacterium]
MIWARGMSNKPAHFTFLGLLLLVAFSILCVYPSSAQAYDNEELEFLTLINNYRAQNGLPALTLSTSLSNAAEGHSYDMAVRNYFSHTSQDGRSPWDRIRAAGYGYNTWLGENIAAGYSTAATAFEAWRNSPGHNANMLSGNFRAIGIGRYYQAGSTYGWYWTTDFGGVSEDSTPPTISVPPPTGGSYVSGTVIIWANAYDNVGINKVDFYIDNILVGTDTTYPFTYNWNTTGYGAGAHTLKAVVTDTAGFTAESTCAVTVDNFTPSMRYFFTWYDQSSSQWRDWVLMANPAGGAGTARAAVMVDSTTYADRNIDVGAPAETPAFNGVIGGPVTVATTQPLITSQRVLYKNSFNEIPAIWENQLESTYYFTWYDSNASQGWKGDWILIGNQGSQTANVEVYIGGSLKGTYSIPVGGRVTPSYSNTTDGPVKVVCTNNQPLIVSQRVLYKDSFNEVLGVPESKLGTEYNFTWYDSRRENNMKGNWILVGNMDSEPALVDIYIGANHMGRYDVPAGGRITPQYPGVMDGPVKVVSVNGQRIIASQRILYQSSFEEFQGLTAADTGTDLWFTWYDSKRANNMNGNWILIANPSQTDAVVDIYINGGLMQRVDVAAGGNVPLSYPNTIGGPVRIVSTNNIPLFVTQRVVYRDSFNEIGGMKLQ